MDAQRVAALITLGRYEFSDHAERERINDGFTDVVRFITVYEPALPKWLNAWTRGEKQ